MIMAILPIKVIIFRAFQRLFLWRVINFQGSSNKKSNKSNKKTGITKENTSDFSGTKNAVKIRLYMLLLYFCFPVVFCLFWCCE
jgi:hypothetical protein